MTPVKPEGDEEVFMVTTSQSQNTVESQEERKDTAPHDPHNLKVLDGATIKVKAFRYDSGAIQVGVNMSERNQQKLLSSIDSNDSKTNLNLTNKYTLKQAHPKPETALPVHHKKTNSRGVASPSPPNHYYSSSHMKSVSTLIKGRDDERLPTNSSLNTRMRSVSPYIREEESSQKWGNQPPSSNSRTNIRYSNNSKQSNIQTDIFARLSKIP